MTLALHSPLSAPRLSLLAGVACLVTLAGCVGQGTLPQAQTSARSAANVAVGVQQVQLGGEAFEARLGDFGQGTRLTAAGAQGVAGQGIAVRRQGAALGMDDGALAKRAARAGCAAAGGALNERAIGRYDAAGAWIFAGGCA